jgi:succinylglutamic semialdehyde dehydrogenase
MHYINGLWVDSGEQEFTSLNPSTGAEIWRGKAAGKAEIEQALAAARAAFEGWEAIGVEERLKFLDKFKQRIELAKVELGALISLETGKAPWDAQSEVAATIAKLTYATEAYHERTGTKSKASAVGAATVRHRAHGVMAVYGPYNFPAHLPNGHIMPALLAGNTIVFKPSELTPLVAQWMVQQWEAVGLPKGVLNLVQGERETGILLSDMPVDGILFTGSSATGKAIHARLAGRPEVMLALEMGGNNPLIVCDVEDIDAAVYETLLSAFTGTGQRCTCARRLILPKWEKRELFISKLIKAAQGLVIGAPNSNPPPFMGPLISMREAKRLLDAQVMLQKLGAKPLLEMKLLKESLPFVTPAILDVTGIEGIPDEEYFGPLLQVYRVDKLEDAVHVANHTRFGLSAAILCDDSKVYEKLSGRIRGGLINWNRQTTGASGAAPFGGIGLSGNHRPAGYYSADYSAYPVASVENSNLKLPGQLAPGVTLS